MARCIPSIRALSAGELVERLNLVSSSVDRELDAIRTTVSSFVSVSGVADLARVLHQRSLRGEPVAVLDAIGHSRSQGFVVIGTWEIDDSSQTAAAFSELLRAPLQRLGVRTIRLLGCSTATTQRGSNAMRRIAQVTGCTVVGTKRYISQHDYGAHGFASDDVLVDADGVSPISADRVGFSASNALDVALASTELAMGPGLTKERPLLPVNETVANDIMRFVDGSRSWNIPGLLAEPSPIVLWSEHNTIHRIEILLDCHVVRAFTLDQNDDHGRLFRVIDPDGLRAYLAALTPRRSEIPARSS